MQATIRPTFVPRTLVIRTLVIRALVIRALVISAFVLGALVIAASVPAVAQTCTQDQFRKVVDDAGSSLRRLHAESQPAIEAGMRRLKAKYGWTDDNYEEKANTLLNDAKTESYDVKASELLSKLDQLAEGKPGSAIDCSRLGELEATALELQATVRVKTRHMLALIEAQAGGAAKTAAADPAQASQSAAVSTAPPQNAGPATLPALAPPPAGAKPVPQSPVAKPVKQPPAAAPAVPAPKPAPVAGWNTSTGSPSAGPAPPPATAPVPMPNLPAPADAFSVDDIREASRGFFGTISSGLGNVIEHAFGKLGKPTAYVLGNEGGGAFIAGVRYGKGILFTRGGRSREVYWHGPSIGYDIGAAGSKTMFLVYGLQDELDIFTGYSGVDGAAYLVGGVGMTVLTDGKMVLAPIRSGFGLRLGASIGYVRFTALPTWNPF